MVWWVYIIECCDASFYVGITDDVERRFAEHAKGVGARYTRLAGVRKVVYKEAFQKQINAFERERQLKKWRRAKKQALILGAIEDLKKASRSREKKKQ